MTQDPREPPPGMGRDPGDPLCPNCGNRDAGTMLAIHKVVPLSNGGTLRQHTKDRCGLCGHEVPIA